MKIRTIIMFLTTGMSCGVVMSSSFVQLGLRVSAVGGEVFFMPPFGTNTGIDDINAASTAAGGQYYNMLGQPVAHPTTGFYILNGKKVFVK